VTTDYECCNLATDETPIEEEQNYIIEGSRHERLNWLPKVSTYEPYYFAIGENAIKYST
jgi:hypothetical protein